MFQQAFAVTDSSHVATARSALGDMMSSRKFDTTCTGRGNLVLTEAATNILKHAGTGTLLLRSLSCGEACGVEVVAVDGGPGVADLERSMTDGVSTAGTQGSGLGAMRRLSDEFDAYSIPDHGLAVRMAIWAKTPELGRCEVGAVCVPLAGEEVCGDGWAVVPHADGATILVADGLGHGLLANEASRAAIAVLEDRPADSASRILESTHGALRATRGAAVAVARCNFATREVTYAAAGNIAATFIRDETRRSMISHAGIVGHKIHSSREIKYEWPEGSLLVMHSDGLETRWDLAGYPGLAARHPALVAAILYRDFARGRDDVTVVVVRLDP